MLFSSFVFLFVFLPATCALYWLAPGQRSRERLLLAASIVFYAYWYVPYVLLLTGLVFVAWLAALASRGNPRSLAAVLAVAFLLLTLAFFKYEAFFLRVSVDLGLLSASRADSLKHGLELPLGISFIVFQAIGYVVDVAKGGTPAERRFETVLLFKAFFPQLIAGPICRASELIPQLKDLRPIRTHKFAAGILIVTVGLFLKLVFADNLSPFVEGAFSRPNELSTLQAWAGALAFSVQILADFWGYSTIAVGLALLFGVDIPINFRLPYLAQSVREFWRRWHITLSTWLRDYLYKPLGGSRAGLLRTFAAVMATMLLGGLWHGANYTFLIWGAVHGFALCLEHWSGRHKAAKDATLVALPARMFRIGLTFLFITLSWVFFRSESVRNAFDFLDRMMSFSGDTRWQQDVMQPLVLIIFFLISHPLYEGVIRRARQSAYDPVLCYGMAVGFGLVTLVMSATNSVPFIYFQF